LRFSDLQPSIAGSPPAACPAAAWGGRAPHTSERNPTGAPRRSRQRIPTVLHCWCQRQKPQACIPVQSDSACVAMHAAQPPRQSHPCGDVKGPWTKVQPASTACLPASKHHTRKKTSTAAAAAAGLPACPIANPLLCKPATTTTTTTSCAAALIQATPPTNLPPYAAAAAAAKAAALLLLLLLTRPPLAPRPLPSNS